MRLSGKYEVIEDGANITLVELVKVEEVVDDVKTGNIVEKEKSTKCHFSTTATGRAQCYNRLINLEVSEAETLQEVLDTVKRCEEQVIEFWEKQCQ
ncbi:conserved hypothetical protein [Vibrio phage 501E54-1]|nr:conserved hypothetical protein [Vibrio phage 501E54-1]